MNREEQVLAEIVENALLQNDEKLVVEVLEQGGSERVRRCLVSEPTLFIRICTAGFTDAARLALDDCGTVINISAQLEGRTALQWACLLGYADIVEALLPYVSPTPDVWRETSEFYSASLGGHIDIVKELTSQYPDFVIDVDVRTALLYAACSGGSLDVVKFWLVPDVDFNKPVELVSNLHNCEHLVPLYAACEGNHKKVASYLMEHFSAEITEHIARNFPDLTAWLVDAVYRPLIIESPDSEDSEVIYRLHNAGVHMVHPTWIQAWLPSITHLDLSRNKLRKLPPGVPWSLPNLKHINISHNRLTQLPPPETADGVLCQNLEEVILSHNELSDVAGEIFNLATLTCLDLSYNHLQRINTSRPTNSAAVSPGRKGSGQVPWQCSSLVTLDLSHNQLDLLTSDICGCSSLKKLIISHNRLFSLPSPWPCNLEYLDASENNLERFPASTEQFWSGSLTTLYLQHNSLDQLVESVLKLGMLDKLDVSHNRIEFLASPHVWDCPSLVDLNLGYNRLGVPQKRGEQVEFPSQLLVKLNRLNLSDNELTSLPLSVCALKNLVSLDISNNPLQDLPQEMGNLMDCWDLKLQGLNFKKPELQEAVKNGKCQDVIHLLRRQLRKVQPCHILKVVVLGPQGKGKSTVVKSLFEGSFSPATVSDKNITKTTLSLKYKLKEKIEKRKDNDRPELTLRIWELPGVAELLALHPVFWTENSLFLLVWDVTAGTSQLGDWLCGIKARLARVDVIIVATFRDRLPSTTSSSEDGSRVDQFHREINQLYGLDDTRSGVYPKDDHHKIYPRLCSVLVVSLVTKQTFKQELGKLRHDIYFSALCLKGQTRGELLIGRQIPLSYTRLDTALFQLAQRYEHEPHRPPFLLQSEFEDLVQCLPESDFETFGDLTEALRVCCHMGSVLHYDVWPEGLRNFYFLGPDWLAGMIAIVLMPSGREAPCRQAMQDVCDSLFLHELPSNILRPFLQLLRHFDISTPIVENGEERLLLPSHLPRQMPGLQLPKEQHSCRLLRFYALPHVPDRLWSRLILDLLASVERFSQLSWQGLKMEKLRVVYWQKGLNITYNGGSVLVESATFHATHEGNYSGILISILPDSAANLAVVGFVSEEVDSAIQNVFPHHSDKTELFGTYALCPVCFDHVRPGQGVIRGDYRHFSMPECAGSLLSGDVIRCHMGNIVPLEDLVPEFLMTELPEKLHLSVNQLIISSKVLGGGAAGSVYKGTYQGKDIAVKVFYSDTQPGDFSPPTTDSGTSSLSSNSSQKSMGYPPVFMMSNTVGSDMSSTVSSTSSDYSNFVRLADHQLAMRQDSIDGRNLKICQAFAELRQETVILSQLHHPCLISLIGVSIRPSLLVALELAPLGSLRAVLKKKLVNRPFNKYLDRDKTFSSVLDKDATFKIVYQIAVGLEYLHERKILYRDLKSDNILVCSLDPKDTVNVKISDYGISKFAAVPMTGMVGTPGYMAPEIMEGQVYDQKIDIFSFSMVIYETLTGHAPFESCERLHQIHHIINNEKRRPALREYNVVSCFPFLEDLMHDMWAHEASERPSASEIVRNMKDVGFILQHSLITPSDDCWARETMAASSVPGSQDSFLFCNVTCAWASKEISSLSGRNTCWMWEYPTSLTHDRRLSIYNLTSSQYHVRRKSCAGQPVTCMARVGSYVWVGVKGGSIEIYGNSCTDVPRRKALLNGLKADPVAIVHDKHSPNKALPEGEGLVYVGLCDGSMCIYSHYRWFRGVFTSEWKLWKTLTISAASLSAMCLVPAHHELWVASGHGLVIISTDKQGLLIERRICVLKDMLQRYGEKVTNIQSIVCNENSLWCSFEGSPLIVEFDLHADVVSGAYCIESDIEVDISEVQLPRGADSQLCDLCGGFASSKDPGGRSSHRGMLQNSGKDDGSLPPPLPPRPPRGTDSHEHAATGTVNCTSVSEDDACLRHHSQTDFKAEATKKRHALHGSLESIDTVGNAYDKDRATITALTHSLEQQVVVPTSDTRAEDLPPPLPPRKPRPVSERPAYQADNIPLIKKKSMTLPDLRVSPRPRPRPPPPPPPTRSLPTVHEGVYVQSLLAIVDMLWVGSSCGEILVIGAHNHYKSTPKPCQRCSTGDETAVKSDTSDKRRSSSLKKSMAGKSNSTANTSTSTPAPRPKEPLNVRMSLNLESKQICNLKSAGMIREEKQAQGPDKVKSGGVQLLVQAQNLVVAVRNVCDEAGVSEMAEVSVWETCCADRITSIRQYWRSLEALKAQQAQMDT